MKGQIVKINSDLHFVNCNGNVYPCKCRGIFRKEHIIPVVGDYVLFNEEKKIIEEVLPRKCIFQRPKVSNIDQAFIVTSLKYPDFSLNLLDKMLVLMELHNVEGIICITKEDLCSKSELIKYKALLSYYEDIGYKVVSNTDLDTIKNLCKDKTSVFTGQTGAGKSTLLNKLNPELKLETNDISYSLGRGKHTTRIVELFEFCGGKLLDTPGFSSLDFNGVSKEKIRDSFKEFSNYPCPYKDCSHTNEKECRIKEEVNSNNIMRSRYDNYLNFIGVDNNES